MVSKESNVRLLPSASGTPANQRVFHATGGGSDGGGIDVRIAKLESDVGSIKDALGRLEPAISSINERTIKIEGDLKHTPKTVSLVFGMFTMKKASPHLRGLRPTTKS